MREKVCQTVLLLVAGQYNIPLRVRMSIQLLMMDYLLFITVSLMRRYFPAVN